MDIKPKSFSHEYETTFILNPELPEGEQKKAVDKYVKLIKKDGKVHNIEHWGLRKLAYPIERKNNGFYAFVEFTAMPDFVAKLEQAFRYDEQVLRYLTVKLEKHALEFSQRRREQDFGMRKEMKNQ